MKLKSTSSFTSAFTPSLAASVLLVFAATLGGCASSNPDMIDRSETQQMSKVEDAVVLSVRSVTVDGKQSGVGAAIGGVVGAIGGYAGSSVQREGQILGVLAAAAGGVAGNAIERMSTREDAYEILVQLKGGERRAIVQAKGAEALQPGDAVIIVTSAGKVRIAKAPK
jgi:outer membrane lipoprotein SlyB